MKSAQNHPLKNAKTHKNSLSRGDAGEGDGETGAILSSLLATVKLDGLDPEAWLTDVLARIVSRRANNNEPREFRLEPEGGARSGRREGRHMSRARRKTAKIAKTNSG